MRMGRILLCSLAVALGLLSGTAAGPASAAGVQATPAAVRVTADRANVREGASTTSTVIATVNRGEELTVIGTSGTWYRVRLRPSNREGYIAMSTVEAVRQAATPAPSTPAPAAPPAAAPAPRPAAPAAQPAPRPAAQTARPRPAAPRAGSTTPWGVRGFIGADGFAPAATKTFSALLGTDSFSGLTAGADVYGGALPFGLFARVGFSKFSADGERVFVVLDGQTFPTGIPLTVKITPIQIGGGVRFRLGQNAANGSFLSRLTPYGGAGVVLLTYQEISDFADDGDNDAEKFQGLSIFGGLDVNIMKYVSAGVEVEFRQISGFATGGVAAEFDEDQLGGTSVKFLIGIGR